MTDKRKLSDLIPDHANANKGTERGRHALEASLRQYGAGRSILLDKNGRIIAGNKTAEVAADVGLEDVVIVQTDGTQIVAVQRTDLDIDSAEGRGLAYADNRVGELSLDWDAEQVLADLSAGVDLSGLWQKDELDELLADLQPKGTEGDTEPEIDRAEELRQKWGVEPGQLWQLGEHRLICGDCTDAAVVARVMGGERAQLCFTDPPYNVDVAGGSHDPRDAKNYRSGNTLANDKMTDADFYDFLLNAFRTTLAAMADGAALYVCFSDSEIRNFVNAFQDAGAYYSQMVIWKKQQLVFGRKDYHSKHEPILYGWKLGAAHFFIDDRTQDTVWEIDRPMRSEKEHPTQKPILLYERAITNSSSSGAIVYEPFSGTGTALIACENLGRRCRAVEISPAYVAVALERWATHTGKTPVLLTD